MKGSLPSLASRFIWNYFFVEMPDGANWMAGIMVVSDEKNGQIRFLPVLGGERLEIDLEFMEKIRHSLVSRASAMCGSSS